MSNGGLSKADMKVATPKMDEVVPDPGQSILVTSTGELGTVTTNPDATNIPKTNQHFDTSYSKIVIKYGSANRRKDNKGTLHVK